MRTKLKFLHPVWLCMALCFSWCMTVGSPDDLFTKANDYYVAKDYDNALKTYQQALNDNASAAVFFNMGNCYFKMGSLGKSILYYERAARISPDDEDIQFNLKVANLKAVDKIEVVPPIIYKRWIKSLSEALTMSQWSVTVIILAWLMFLAWAAYLFAASIASRKITFALACVVTVLCGISFLFLEGNYRVQTKQKYGVVMAASSYVKSAPDERGNDQFILHEGTKVEVLDELGTWEKIRIANGSVGWLKTADVEII